MNTIQRKKIRIVALSIVMMVLMTGCDRSEQTDASAGNQASAGQHAGDQKPLGHVTEFDGFTLRANVSRTDLIPDAMAQKYGIEPEANLFLLNLVVLEDRPDRQPVPVSAEVSARYESHSGHGEAIDMRAVEAKGQASYIGTLDASGQRLFQLVIMVQPEGTDTPLQMSFEVQLEKFEVGGFE